VAKKLIKLFVLDFNWIRDAPDRMRPSLPHELCDADPAEFVQWHLDIGCNALFQHAYTFNGCAWYPSKLGPRAPEPGDRFMPRVLDLAHARGLSFHTYFCVGQDRFVAANRPDWTVPGSNGCGAPMLAPESGWTDLLCRRVEELVRSYPVDAILFDWFVYGDLKPDFPVTPAPFVEAPFRNIIGRPMPQRPEDITAAESLRYKREVLARQFRMLRDAAKSVRPDCALYFNVPYWAAAEPLWVDHPMLRESDWLFAECSRTDVVDWLLSTRRADQRVVVTFSGRLDAGQCDARSWRALYEKGCDFFGYCFPRSDSMWPGPWYDEEVSVVREAFRALPDARA
jgi:hypothetical protein